MFSCQRRAFICLFSRVLKVVYEARGLSVSVSVFVCICDNSGWCKNEVKILHLSFTLSLYQVEKYSGSSTEQNLATAYLFLITEICHWSSAKCWHKMSQTCRWPFWVSQSRAGARYKSWQSMWWKLFLLDILGTPALRFLAFQCRHQEKMSPFLFTWGNTPIKCDFKARPW